MSTHVVKTAPESVQNLVALCDLNLRAPSNVTADETTGEVSLWFDPDLTAEEVTIFKKLDAMASSSVTLTFEEFDALLPELKGLRQYDALATPTNAQSVAAIKALIHVVNALMSDDEQP